MREEGEQEKCIEKERGGKNNDRAVRGRGRVEEEEGKLDIYKREEKEEKEKRRKEEK